MTTVSFTTIPEAFPEGTVAGPYNVQILNSTGTAVQAMNVSGTEAVFSQALDPGTYTVHVQLLDASMSPLGPVVSSDPFTIAAPTPITIDLQVPNTVTVAP